MHALADAVRPNVPAGVYQPNGRPVLIELLAQQVGIAAGRVHQERRAITSGWVACGSLTRGSVPETLTVQPDKKWYKACSAVSRALGGGCPKAAAVQKIVSTHRRGCTPDSIKEPQRRI